MTSSTETHEFVASTCLHIGRPCPAAEQMLRRLSQAIVTAKDVTQDDFEISGQGILNGCAKNCPARFVANHSRIRIFCDVKDDATTEALDQFADAMLSGCFSQHDHTLSYGPASSRPPRAFAEARPHKTVPAIRESSGLSTPSLQT